MSGRRKALIIASGEYDHEAHLSCHGLKNDSGELFFAARNTRPNRLGSTAIPADFVRRCMRSSRSRSIVLLLDCCYGAAFGQGVAVRAGDVNVLDSFPGDKLGGGRGRAVITASSSMEYAFEGDRLADDHRRRPSLFTSALVEGLATGDADRDEDGWVSLNELYDYVFDRVREQNPNQTPSRDIETQGELYVARSRRRRVRPLHIPADLQAAMADPNMFTRLGAVTELRSRLTSDNLPAAAGARDALADIARTDIHYLAQAAATALREVAIQPVERELHFGQVAKDASPARRTVRLLGPPLARACTFQASDRWIRIEETTEGIQVSVDTSRAGTLRGDITITGPTGKAVIPVDVEITPEPEPPPPAIASPVTTAGPRTGPAPPPAARTRRPAALLPRVLGTVTADQPAPGRASSGTAAQPPDSAGPKPAPLTIERVSDFDRFLQRWLPLSRSARTLTAVALLLAVIVGTSVVLMVIRPQQIHIDPDPLILIGHIGSAYSVAFSPDGKTLATGSSRPCLVPSHLQDCTGQVLAFRDSLVLTTPGQALR
ncbi:MAG: hypothetical protein ACRDRX_18475 [Pseudonocardiaceae bacterium]